MPRAGLEPNLRRKKLLSGRAVTPHRLVLTRVFIPPRPNQYRRFRAKTALEGSTGAASVPPDRLAQTRNNFGSRIQALTPSRSSRPLASALRQRFTRSRSRPSRASPRATRPLVNVSRSSRRRLAAPADTTLRSPRAFSERSENLHRSTALLPEWIVPYPCDSLRSGYNPSESWRRQFPEIAGSLSIAGRPIARSKCSSHRKRVLR